MGHPHPHPQSPGKGSREGLAEGGVGASFHILPRSRPGAAGGGAGGRERKGAPAPPPTPSPPTFTVFRARGSPRGPHPDPPPPGPPGGRALRPVQLPGLRRSPERPLPGPGFREVAAGGQEEKQSPQHSMQISRQSADSQQASRMPQSRSQGRSQSVHSPEPQQQQQRHESSELQEPHVAQSRTMLHSVRNSQNRQDRMQCTQQSAGGERGRVWEAPGQGQPPAQASGAVRSLLSHSECLAHTHLVSRSEGSARQAGS